MDQNPITVMVVLKDFKKFDPVLATIEREPEVIRMVSCG